MQASAREAAPTVGLPDDTSGDAVKPFESSREPSKAAAHVVPVPPRAPLWTDQFNMNPEDAQMPRSQPSATKRDSGACFDQIVPHEGTADDVRPTGAGNVTFGTLQKDRQVK